MKNRCVSLRDSPRESRQGQRPLASCYYRLLWRRLMRKVLMLCVAFAATLASAQQYDIVLEGGRAMDPETNLDAVRNVGIRDGKIARIASEPLSARRVIQVQGLVVAPGFIDLHQ